MLGGALARAMRVEVVRVSAPLREADPAAPDAAGVAERAPAGPRRRDRRASRAERPASACKERGRWRTTVAVLGPAFVACIAYLDPGNFATNIAGGATYGYMLLWVLLAANLMAMLIQNLSGKIGIATGRNLPELCREHFSRERHARPLGPGGDRRDGDRPRRVRRRRDRAQPALRHPAVRRRR